MSRKQWCLLVRHCRDQTEMHGFSEVAKYRIDAAVVRPLLRTYIALSKADGVDVRAPCAQ